MTPVRALRAKVAAIAIMALGSPAMAADPPEWSAPYPPFRIADNIYYVGTKRGDTDYGVRPFPRVTVDATVGDGETLRLGTIALTAHLTPGHTPGCTSWSMTIVEPGVPRNVLFACSISVAGNLLVGNRAYPGIVKDFRATFAKLATMRADIVLTSHPEVSDLFGRQARRDAGNADAFIDPTALPKLVAQSRAEFEDELGKAHKAAH
jgi:metallo-beta-lactamase class B